MITGYKTRKTRHTTCPHCGDYHNKADTKTNQHPKVGDISICAYCAGISLYGENGLEPAALTDFNPDEQALIREALKDLATHWKTSH